MTGAAMTGTGREAETRAAACALAENVDALAREIARLKAEAGAVLLGGFADGAWIARVATRREIGFWRALWMLAAGEMRAGRRRCWVLLFGGGAGKEAVKGEGR